MLFIQDCRQLDSSRLKVSVTECPLTLFVNFTITSGVKYEQVKVIKCPSNSSP